MSTSRQCFSVHSLPCSAICLAMASCVFLPRSSPAKKTMMSKLRGQTGAARRGAQIGVVDFERDVAAASDRRLPRARTGPKAECAESTTPGRWTT